MAEAPLHQLQPGIPLPVSGNIHHVPVASCSLQDEQQEQVGTFFRLLFHNTNTGLQAAVDWVAHMSNPVPLWTALLAALGQPQPPTLVTMCSAHQAIVVRALQQWAAGERGQRFVPCLLPFLEHMTQVLCAADDVEGVDQHAALRLRLALLASQVDKGSTFAARLLAGKRLPAWLQSPPSAHLPPSAARPDSGVPAHPQQPVAVASAAKQVVAPAAVGFTGAATPAGIAGCSNPQAGSSNAAAHVTTEVNIVDHVQMLLRGWQQEGGDLPLSQRSTWLEVAGRLPGQLPAALLPMVHSTLSAAQCCQLYRQLAHEGCSYQEVCSLLRMLLWPQVCCLEGPPSVDLLVGCSQVMQDQAQAFTATVLYPALQLSPMRAGQAELLLKLLQKADLPAADRQAALSAATSSGSELSEANITVFQALLASRPALTPATAYGVGLWLQHASQCAELKGSAKLAKAFVAVLQCPGVEPALPQLQQAAGQLLGAGGNMVRKKVSCFAA